MKLLGLEFYKCRRRKVVLVCAAVLAAELVWFGAYLTRQDAEMQDVLLCVQTGKLLEEPNRMRYEPQEFYVKSEQEMRALFPQCPEAVDNTQKIADACNLEFEFGVRKLPEFKLPEGEQDGDAYFQRLCRQGFARRYPNAGQEHLERLEMEMGVIRQMGFVDYFLIVSDFIGYAKAQGIPVGPGRGSAAGSMVSYCLDITDIDPMKYSLYFERFLNPERVTMPDIDIDFCIRRRQEVIDYVAQKYGQDHPAHIHEGQGGHPGCGPGAQPALFRGGRHRQAGAL